MKKKVQLTVYLPEQADLDRLEQWAAAAEVPRADYLAYAMLIGAEIVEITLRKFPKFGGFGLLGVRTALETARREGVDMLTLKIDVNPPAPPTDPV